MTFRDTPTLHALLVRRLDRRRLLGGGIQLAAATLLSGSGHAQSGAPASPTLPRIGPSKADPVVVPDGYRSQVLVRWGDPLFADAPALDPRAVASGALLTPEAAAAQALQFGYNCDGLGVLALDAGRALLCVNHEFPSPALLFPGWIEARDARALGAFVREHPSVVAYMQAAVGLSVVELERDSGWRYRRSSPYNRRVTANTPIELAGPVRDHPLLNPRGESVPRAFGTFNSSIAASASGSARAPIAGSLPTSASTRRGIRPRASSSAGSSSSTRSRRNARSRSAPRSGASSTKARPRCSRATAAPPSTWATTSSSSTSTSS